MRMVELSRLISLFSLIYFICVAIITYFVLFFIMASTASSYILYYRSMSNYYTERLLYPIYYILSMRDRQNGLYTKDVCIYKILYWFYDVLPRVTGGVFVKKRFSLFMHFFYEKGVDVASISSIKRMRPSSQSYLLFLLYLKQLTDFLTRGHCPQEARVCRARGSGPKVAKFNF